MSTEYQAPWWWDGLTANGQAKKDHSIPFSKDEPVAQVGSGWVQGPRGKNSPFLLPPPSTQWSFSNLSNWIDEINAPWLLGPLSKAPVPWDGWEPHVAFYAPVHTFGPYWGIYFRWDRMSRVVHSFRSFLKKDPETSHLANLYTELLTWLVFNAVYDHEICHWEVEVFATRLELAAQEAGQFPPLYLGYQKRHKGQTTSAASPDEEAVANARLLERAAGRLGLSCLEEVEGTALRKSLILWQMESMQKQAPGYNRGPQVFRDGLSARTVKSLHDDIAQGLSEKVPLHGVRVPPPVFIINHPSYSMPSHAVPGVVIMSTD